MPAYASFDPVNRCSIYNNRAGAGQDILAHSINPDLSIPLHTFTVGNPTRLTVPRSMNSNCCSM